jgi:4-amino-4-deoxy-L-arabinose transferase
LALGNEIQEVDPAQYAEIGRRLYDSRTWGHLEDNFGPYHAKGPVTFWVMAAGFALFDQTSVGVRFPALVFGALLLLATARIGRLLWGSVRTGLLAAGFVGASLGFHLMVADPKIDMGLTALTAAAVWMALEARVRRGWMAFSWMFMGLAFLTKGPIGICAPLAALVPEVSRRPWGAAPGTPNQSFLHRVMSLRPLLGVAVLAAVIGPWFLQLHARFGAEGPLFQLWEQGVGRLLSDDFANRTTPAFYLHTALWAFSPFVLVLAYDLFERFSAFIRERRLQPDETRIVLWWLVIVLAVISIARGKLPQYVFWLLPPGALLAARRLTLMEVESARALGTLRWIQLAMGVLAAGFGVFVLRAAFPPGTAGGFAFWSVLLFAVPIGAWLLSSRTRPIMGVAVSSVGSIAGLLVLFHGHLHRELLKFQPDRELGELARKEDPRGKILPVFQTVATNAAAFYARRPARAMSANELQVTLSERRAGVAMIGADAVETLRQAGLKVEPLLELPRFHTSIPSRAFLGKSTRDSVVERVMLARVSLATTESWGAESRPDSKHPGSPAQGWSGTSPSAEPAPLR